jgi:hypothetical protein
VLDDVRGGGIHASVKKHLIQMFEWADHGIRGNKLLVLDVGFIYLLMQMFCFWVCILCLSYSSI